MNSTDISSSANYKIITPISVCSALISITISCGILILIRSKKRLHTISHLLICNTCISSIYCSFVQSINYICLIFVTWDTSDISCRFHAYFGYMSIAAVIYSYFIQALSRYFFSIFHRNHRWMLTFKIHYIIVLIQWIILILIPLPSLITHDIYYRPTFLCWVPRNKTLHVLYTLFAYYLIPIIFIICIYLNIYKQVKSAEKTNLEAIRKIRQNRNLEILRNILILIGIYTFGGIPTVIYIITKIEIFYSIGIIFLSLFVTFEKIITILLDRDIRNIIKNYFLRSTTKITPIIQPKLQF